MVKASKLKCSQISQKSFWNSKTGFKAMAWLFTAFGSAQYLTGLDAFKKFFDGKFCLFTVLKKLPNYTRTT